VTERSGLRPLHRNQPERAARLVHSQLAICEAR
jgi:hypothetical protein